MKTERCVGTPPHIWLGMLGEDGKTGVAPQLTISHSQTDSGAEPFTLGRSLTTGPQTHFVIIRFGVYKGYGKAWVDDVSLKPLAIDYEAQARPLTGKVRERDGKAVLEASDAAADLGLTATFEGFQDRIHVRGKLSDTWGEDRAIMLWLRLPLRLDASWNFGYDINQEVPIGELPAYSHTLPIAPGQTMSQYSWASVRDGESGLALSVPMDQPRMFRLAYSPRYGYYVVFDPALSPATAAFPQWASFFCDVFQFEPKHGFRAAVQRYYEILPQFFHEWLEGHGSWSHAVYEWDKQLRPRDYGVRWQVFQYHQNRNIQDDSAAQVITVGYIEPNGYWGWRPDIEPFPQITKQPPYEELIGPVREMAAKGERVAPRIIQTGIFDANDRYFIGGWQPKWGGAHWDANPDPSLPDVEGNISNLGTDSWDHIVMRGDIYHCQGMCSDAGPFRRQNSRRDHLPHVAHPLSFRYDTKRLCVPPLVHSQELYEWMKGKLQERDWHFLLHWCGAGAPTHLFGIHFGDTIGNEQLSAPLNENQYVTQRTLCYRKTTQAYVNRAKEMPVDLREHYCRQDLAYGFFSDPRHPVLGRLHVGLQQELARAGWEPITGATSSSEAVHLERFGCLADGSLHFTVRNDLKEPVEALVKLDEQELGALDGPLCQIADNMLEASASEPLTGARIGASLGPSTVRVIRIGTAEQLARLWEPELQRQWQGVVNYLGMAGEGTVPQELAGLAQGRERGTAAIRGAMALAVGAAGEDRWIRHAALALAEADRIDSTMRLMAQGQWAKPTDGWPVRAG